MLENGVVCTPKPHHLKDEGVLVEVVRRAKPDWQVDLPEGLHALASRDVMEQRRAGPQLIQTDPHQS
jgi:hypothetical protein